MSTNGKAKKIKPPSTGDVNGIVYVGYDKKDKHLSELWRKEGIKTEFPARTHKKILFKD